HGLGSRARDPQRGDARDPGSVPQRGEGQANVGLGATLHAGRRAASHHRLVRGAPGFGPMIITDAGLAGACIVELERREDAHGFQTLVDGAEVAYQMSAVHVADAERGVRWDDPAFGIIWPEPVRVISERDRTYPDFVTQAAR